MQRRGITLRFSALVLVLVLASTQLSWAQIRIPEAALQEQTEISRVLDEGSQLEKSGRWTEAVNMYEHASRDYPSNHDILNRLHLARSHVDVQRRYADASFIDAVKFTDMSRSMLVYNEILEKIDTYHVDRPDFKHLVMRGMEQVEAGLNDPRFQETNMGLVSVGSIEQARQKARAVIDANSIRTRQEAYQVVDHIARQMSQELGMQPQAVVYEFTCGAVNALDWYSSFLTSGQYGDVMSQIEGNFVGLGVELRPFPDRLEIVNVISTGPAGRGGMKSGELILAVDGVTVSEIGGERAADMLRGEEGSFVTVRLSNKGQVRELQLTRQVVDIPSVEGARIVDVTNGVAYFKISSFQRSSRQETVDALWALHRQGMRSLIIDLRGNPGGLLDAAVDIADLFVTEGTIVSTRGRNPNEDQVRFAHREGTWQVPLTVLIDGDSASASEILAGALHDHQRATVVGQKSYGKGSVQGIFPLNVVEGGIRLTTAKFYSPSGKEINRRGVTPNMIVTTVAKPSTEAPIGQMEETLDPAMSTAIKVASEKTRVHQ